MKLQALEGIAYHEAGHALAVHVQGLPLVSVTIVPDDTYAGRCEWAPNWREARARLEQGCPMPGDRELVKRSLLVILAGPIAEEVFAGSWHPVTRDEDDTQVEIIVQALAKPRTNQDGDPIGW